MGNEKIRANHTSSECPREGGVVANADNGASANKEERLLKGKRHVNDLSLTNNIKRGYHHALKGKLVLVNASPC